MNIYPKSVHKVNDTQVAMVRMEDADYLLITGENPGFKGEETAEGLLAPKSRENAALLRELFPFTAPKPVLSEKRTIGLGDRLGLATPGQLRAVSRYDAVPILAQQSIREITLTESSFENVLDAATFAVFREDFQRGYGFDGDHLKTDEEVKYALGCGITMLTLDCSEHIHAEYSDVSDAEIEAAYKENKELEELYCGKTFEVEGIKIEFTPEDFRRNVLIYGEAIDHAVRIFHTYVEGKPICFEMSIDETTTPTSPAQHYFVSSELIRRGVEVVTVALRFVGEFQKGIDYIGDLAQFEAEFAVHAAIARHFGYKISVHSGSDKFSVFPIVGRLTQGKFHMKTAGTSWLEAMTVVAEKDPALYREVHQFALDVFDEVTTYYHVTTDLTKVPALDTLTDEQLPDLFKLPDARQLIHITYGPILTRKDENGNYLFHDRLYKFWRENEERYCERLDNHIGNHLKQLYSEIPEL